MEQADSAMIDFKGSHFEREVILWGVRWYVAYPMSHRQLEEMLEERGVEVDHSTLNRWVVKYAPLLEKQLRARKRAVGPSWRLDETYAKVKGFWKYLYRAVDNKAGATVDFLLTAERDCKAALRFLRKAIGLHGEPEKITIDKSGANTAAIESYNAEHEADIEIRRIKYLNNIVEQPHALSKGCGCAGGIPSDPVHGIVHDPASPHDEIRRTARREGARSLLVRTAFIVGAEAGRARSAE
jgi:putative transposase